MLSPRPSPWRKWKRKVEKDQPDEHHFSQWTRAKDNRKHELDLGNLYAEIRWVYRIFLEHYSTGGSTKELLDWWSQAPRSNQRRQEYKLCKTCSCSVISSKSEVRSTKLWPWGKPAWSSSVHLWLVQHSRLKIIPVNSFNVVLAKLNSLWFSLQDLSLYWLYGQVTRGISTQLQAGLHIPSPNENCEDKRSWDPYVPRR